MILVSYLGLYVVMVKESNGAIHFYQDPWSFKAITFAKSYLVPYFG